MFWQIHCLGPCSLHTSILSDKLGPKWLCDLAQLEGALWNCFEKCDTVADNANLSANWRKRQKIQFFFFILKIAKCICQNSNNVSIHIAKCICKNSNNVSIHIAKCICKNSNNVSVQITKYICQNNKNAPAIQRWANSVFRTEYEYEYFSLSEMWPNTNTNIIRV